MPTQRAIKAQLIGKRAQEAGVSKYKQHMYEAGLWGPTTRMPVAAIELLNFHGSARDAALRAFADDSIDADMDLKEVEYSKGLLEAELARWDASGCADWSFGESLMGEFTKDEGGSPLNMLTGDAMRMPTLRKCTGYGYMVYPQPGGQPIDPGDNSKLGLLTENAAPLPVFPEVATLCGGLLLQLWRENTHRAFAAHRVCVAKIDGLKDEVLKNAPSEPQDKWAPASQALLRRYYSRLQTASGSKAGGGSDDLGIGLTTRAVAEQGDEFVLELVSARFEQSVRDFNVRIDKTEKEFEDLLEQSGVVAQRRLKPIDDRLREAERDLKRVIEIGETRHKDTTAAIEKNIVDHAKKIDTLEMLVQESTTSTKREFEAMASRNDESIRYNATKGRQEMAILEKRLDEYAQAFDSKLFEATKRSENLVQKTAAETLEKMAVLEKRVVEQAQAIDGKLAEATKRLESLVHKSALDTQRIEEETQAIDSKLVEATKRLEGLVQKTAAEATVVLEKRVKEQEVSTDRKVAEATKKAESLVHRSVSDSKQMVDALEARSTESLETQAARGRRDVAALERRIEQNASAQEDRLARTVETVENLVQEATATTKRELEASEARQSESIQHHVLQAKEDMAVLERRMDHQAKKADASLARANHVLEGVLQEAVAETKREIEAMEARSTENLQRRALKGKEDLETLERRIGHCSVEAESQLARATQRFEDVLEKAALETQQKLEALEARCAPMEALERRIGHCSAEAESQVARATQKLEGILEKATMDTQQKIKAVEARCIPVEEFERRIKQYSGDAERQVDRATQKLECFVEAAALKTQQKVDAFEARSTERYQDHVAQLKENIAALERRSEREFDRLTTKAKDKWEDVPETIAALERSIKAGDHPKQTTEAIAALERRIEHLVAKTGDPLGPQAVAALELRMERQIVKAEDHAKQTTEAIAALERRIEHQATKAEDPVGPQAIAALELRMERQVVKAEDHAKQTTEAIAALERHIEHQAAQAEDPVALELRTQQQVVKAEDHAKQTTEAIAALERRIEHQAAKAEYPLGPQAVAALELHTQQQVVKAEDHAKQTTGAIAALERHIEHQATKAEDPLGPQAVAALELRMERQVVKAEDHAKQTTEAIAALERRIEHQAAQADDPVGPQAAAALELRTQQQVVKAEDHAKQTTEAIAALERRIEHQAAKAEGRAAQRQEAIIASEPCNAWESDSRETFQVDGAARPQTIAALELRMEQQVAKAHEQAVQGREAIAALEQRMERELEALRTRNHKAVAHDALESSMQLSAAEAKQDLEDRRGAGAASARHSGPEIERQLRMEAGSQDDVAKGRQTIATLERCIEQQAMDAETHVVQAKAAIAAFEQRIEQQAAIAEDHAAQTREALAAFERRNDLELDDLDKQRSERWKGDAAVDHQTVAALERRIEHQAAKAEDFAVQTKEAILAFEWRSEQELGALELRGDRSWQCEESAISKWERCMEQQISEAEGQLSLASVALESLVQNAAAEAKHDLNEANSESFLSQAAQVRRDIAVLELQVDHQTTANEDHVVGATHLLETFVEETVAEMHCELAEAQERFDKRENLSARRLENVLLQEGRDVKLSARETEVHTQETCRMLEATQAEVEAVRQLGKTAGDECTELQQAFGGTKLQAAEAASAVNGFRRLLQASQREMHESLEATTERWREDYTEMRCSYESSVYGAQESLSLLRYLVTSSEEQGSEARQTLELGEVEAQEAAGAIYEVRHALEVVEARAMESEQTLEASFYFFLQEGANELESAKEAVDVLIQERFEDAADLERRQRELEVTQERFEAAVSKVTMDVDSQEESCKSIKQLFSMVETLEAQGTTTHRRVEVAEERGTSTCQRVEAIEARVEKEVVSSSARLRGTSEEFQRSLAASGRFEKNVNSRLVNYESTLEVLEARTDALQRQLDASEDRSRNAAPNLQRKSHTSAATYARWQQTHEPARVSIDTRGQLETFVEQSMECQQKCEATESSVQDALGDVRFTAYILEARCEDFQRTLAASENSSEEAMAILRSWSQASLAQDEEARQTLEATEEAVELCFKQIGEELRGALKISVMQTAETQQSLEDSFYFFLSEATGELEAQMEALRTDTPKRHGALDDTSQEFEEVQQELAASAIRSEKAFAEMRGMCEALEAQGKETRQRLSVSEVHSYQDIHELRHMYESLEALAMDGQKKNEERETLSKDEQTEAEAKDARSKEELKNEAKDARSEEEQMNEAKDARSEEEQRNEAKYARSKDVLKNEAKDARSEEEQQKNEAKDARSEEEQRNEAKDARSEEDQKNEAKDARSKEEQRNEAKDARSEEEQQKNEAKDARSEEEQHKNEAKDARSEDAKPS